MCVGVVVKAKNCGRKKKAMRTKEKREIVCMVRNSDDTKCVCERDNRS